MSIWASIGSASKLPDVMPRRDNYTGEPDDTGTFSLHVATSPTWNDCVRLVADSPDGSICELLTIEEARALAADLETACARIEAVRNRSTAGGAA